MNRTLLAAPAAALLLLTGAPTASANEVDVERGSRPITVGLGVIWRDQVYDDFEDSDKWQPVPLVLWEGKKFFFRADTFGYKLIDSGPWEISPIITLQGNGYDEDNSDIFDGMGDRDPWVGAGGQIIWQPAKFGLKVMGTGDITDESNGGRFKGEGFYTNRVNQWSYRFGAGAEWVSEGYNEYYYGVKRNEAIPGVRPRYNPTDGVNYYATAFMSYNLNKWLFMGFAKYQFFSDEVDDSPLTEDDQMLTLGAGVAYVFGGK
jgi:outer membrane protein